MSVVRSGNTEAQQARGLHRSFGHWHADRAKR